MLNINNNAINNNKKGGVKSMEELLTIIIRTAYEAGKQAGKDEGYGERVWEEATDKPVDENRVPKKIKVDMMFL